MPDCILYVGNVMLSDDLKLIELPSTDELACSDDIPVDNEDQNFLPIIRHPNQSSSTSRSRRL